MKTKSTSPSAATPAPTRKAALVFALLCLLGVAVSVELTRIHVFVHTDPSYHSVCAMSEGVNCETVAASPYSVAAGLPVSVWGIAGYLLMGCLALWAWSRRRLHPLWAWGLLLLLALVSTAVSAVLVLISATRIDSLCVFCMTSYAINVGLLVLALVVTKRSGARARVLCRLDIEALASRPFLAVPLAVAGLAALVVLQILVPRYWQTPGWRDLPRLASGTDAQGHHWIGAPDPALTIVEFSDYECPHCRAAHKQMRLAAAKYPKRIRLIHRHLPLDMACHPGMQRPLHLRACLFAEVAECAGLQGRFWDMNDALFSIQDKVKSKDVDAMDLAVRLGLNRSEFKQCLADRATAGRIAADVQESMLRRLDGTPTFLIEDRVFLGGIPEPQLEQLLQGAR